MDISFIVYHKTGPWNEKSAAPKRFKIISARAPTMPIRIEFLWGLRKGRSLFCLSVIFQYQFSWSVGNAIILFSRSILLANVSFGEMRLYWQGCIDAFLHFWQKPLILTWAAILSILVFVEWKEIFFLNNIFIIVEWYLALKRRKSKFLKRHPNNITLASPLSILLRQATMARWGVDF